MSLPFISCICPTYKRPRLLQNALACFEAQDYPKDRCELIIYDDAQQFDSQQGDNWRLIKNQKRFSNLPDKFNAMVKESKGEIIAVWEDDDIFFPWNLSDVAASYAENGPEFYVSKNVWSTYEQELGEVQKEDATNRFHSSWRFTRRLFDKVKGYPETNELSFDQQLGTLLRAGANGVSYYGSDIMPSYIYRWGNGYWHGSQKGSDGYQNLWDYVGSLPAEYQGKLTPLADSETRKIYRSFGWEI